MARAITVPQAPKTWVASMDDLPLKRKPRGGLWLAGLGFALIVASGILLLLQPH
jgi:hypothetical protein